MQHQYENQIIVKSRANNLKKLTKKFAQFKISL